MVADVSPARPGGGGERMLWEQAWRLAARGHDVRIVSRAPGDGEAAAEVRQGVRMNPFRVNRRTSVRFAVSSMLAARRAVTRALREEPADVLHVHQPFAGYGAPGSRPARHGPTLYSFYSPAPLEYRARRRMTAHHHGRWTGAVGGVALRAIEPAWLGRAGLIHVLRDFSAAPPWTSCRVPRERLAPRDGAAPTGR